MQSQILGSASKRFRLNAQTSRSAIDLDAEEAPKAEAKRAPKAKASGKYAADRYHDLSVKERTSPYAMTGHAVCRTPLSSFSKHRHWPTVLCPLVAVSVSAAESSDASDFDASLSLLALKSNLRRLGHALDAWVALDVFAVVVGTCGLDFGTMTWCHAKLELSSHACVQADVRLEKGITMVFTGEMDQITRHEAEEKAKAAGAKVLSAVSGNVQFLVVGSRLDDGRPVEETGKYRKMIELKEKGKKHPEVLTEAQFLERLPDASAPRPAVARQPVASETPAGPKHQSWVDRWAPRSFEDLIGNASAIRSGSVVEAGHGLVLGGQGKV
eukprot:Skav233694  [mRNA]  locus=scaffold1927:261057:269820:- [translate_table: standard]